MSRQCLWKYEGLWSFPRFWRLVDKERFPVGFLKEDTPAWCYSVSFFALHNCLHTAYLVVYFMDHPVYHAM